MGMNQNWVQDMLELYKQGYSDVEVCKELGISKKQFSRYCANSEPFAELVEYGHDLAEAWAISQNRLAITGDNFNAVNMKALEKRLENMHGWSQKVETKNANANLEMDVAKLKQELYTLLPDMAKMAGRDDIVLQLAHNPVSNDAE